MHHKYGYWQRYWSLVTALGLPLMVFFVLDRYETRVITSIACMILLIHSWFMQRRYTQNRFHLLFWTLVLFLPMLGASWLGLNVIRAATYNYAVDYQRHHGDFRQSLYWNVVTIQGLIIRIARAELLLIPLLAAVSLLKRKTAKQNSNMGGESSKIR
jgi:hypothetical protein